MAAINSLIDKYFPIIELGWSAMTSLSLGKPLLCSEYATRALFHTKKACLVLATCLVAAMLCAAPALAEENTAVTNNQDRVDIGNGDTKLVVDAETNTVSIIIDGKIMAVIDKEGLRVDGPVRSHSGSLDHLALEQGGGDHDAP